MSARALGVAVRLRSSFGMCELRAWRGVRAGFWRQVESVNSEFRCETSDKSLVAQTA